MRKITLTQGREAIVDDEDFEYLNQWRWYAVRKKNHFYAARNEGGIWPKIHIIKMHRAILNPPDNMHVDHINGDGLDNRRENIRACRPRQNNMNRRMGINNTSGYKGVSWNKSDKKWQAMIGVNMTVKYLGKFMNKEEAAAAYNNAAIKEFGDFAQLNNLNEAKTSEPLGS